MVDVNALRKKFPAKRGDKARRVAKIKAIAREYELKKAELAAGGAPQFKRGVVFYAVVIGLLAILGSLVLSATGRGGRAYMSKAHIQATNSVEALAVALGRYRYHTGVYPTTAEGIERLAAILPQVKGWNGPYIKKAVKDPWGRPYEYVYNGENDTPTLYSRGPDALAGTSDDIIAAAELFERPYKDRSWLKGWMPYTLRGYVVVDDEEMKKSVEKSVREHMNDYAEDEKIGKTSHIDVDALMAAAGVTAEYLSAVRTAEAGSGVFIVGDWNRKEGVETQVECLTSADEAELFLDGVSLGRKRAEGGAAVWNIPFSAGELKAIAFKNGRPVAFDRIGTALSPASLAVESLSGDSLSDGEAAVVAVTLLDRKGDVVPSPDWSALKWTVSGPGRQIFPDGDSYAAGGAKAVVAVQRLPGSGRSVKIDFSYPGAGGGVVYFKRKP